MLLFYGLYAVLLLILAPFLTVGRGFIGFLYFFFVSLAIPFIAPLLWAYLWAPGNTASNIRIVIVFHLLAASLALGKATLI